MAIFINISLIPDIKKSWYLYLMFTKSTLWPIQSIGRNYRLFASVLSLPTTGILMLGSGLISLLKEDLHSTMLPYNIN